MEQKRSKCRNLQPFECKFRVFTSYLSKTKQQRQKKHKQSVYSIILLCSGTLYSFFLPFFVLDIFKF